MKCIEGFSNSKSAQHWMTPVRVATNGKASPFPPQHALYMRALVMQFDLHFQDDMPGGPHQSQPALGAKLIDWQAPDVQGFWNATKDYDLCLFQSSMHTQRQGNFWAILCTTLNA